MGVVRAEARRRWILVGGAVAVLCLLPVAVARLPVAGAAADPAELRRLILASDTRPYQGYVDSRARLGVPDLPAVEEVVGLFAGDTRMRVWYSSPRAWRVAVLNPAGERDIYRVAESTYVWDFGRNMVTETVGDLPIRLPDAVDLQPPDLARRLLRAAPGDPVAALPAKRVAGVAAAGLRLVPSDVDATIGRVDVWADPATGLPLQVEVTGRGATTPAVRSRFLELAQSPPAPALLAPARPATAGVTTTTRSEALAAIGTIAALGMPPTLAGRERQRLPTDLTTVEGVAVYGSGLSTFVVTALPGRYGSRTLQAARDAGGEPLRLDRGQGYQIRTPLLSMAILRTDGDRLRRRTFLLAGFVHPDVLTRAAVELLGWTAP